MFNCICAYEVRWNIAPCGTPALRHLFTHTYTTGTLKPCGWDEMFGSFLLVVDAAKSYFLAEVWICREDRKWLSAMLRRACALFPFPLLKIILCPRAGGRRGQSLSLPDSLSWRSFSAKEQTTSGSCHHSTDFLWTTFKGAIDVSFTFFES